MDPGNWHSIDRKFALCELLKLCRTVPGDTVECGAYKGATSYLICREQALNGAEKHRHHFVFDSFAGLSEPDGRDGSYWTAGDLQATEGDVRAALADSVLSQSCQGDSGALRRSREPAFCLRAY